MRRRADIAESATEVRGGVVFSTPKSHQARSVPIPRFLVDALAVQVAGKGPGEFMFPSPRGQVLRVRNWRRGWFDPAAKAIGLDGLHPHELRHTAASLAIASGADTKVVQQMLGHKSAVMTMDSYGHLYGDRSDEVADALDVAARAADLYPLCNDAAVVDLDSARGSARGQ